MLWFVEWRRGVVVLIKWLCDEMVDWVIRYRVCYFVGVMNGVLVL